MADQARSRQRGGSARRAAWHGLTIAILLAALGAQVLADYRDAFARGIRAQRNERWREVAEAMREAIREKANDSNESIPISGFGDRVPYTPNFWLGIALYHLKDCRNALDAFRSSEKSGGWQRVSSGNRERAVKFRQECEATRVAENPTPSPKADTPPADLPNAGPDPAAVNAAVQAAESAINRAQQAQNAVGGLSNDEYLSKVWRADASLGAEEQRAKDTLARARGELDAGRKGTPNLQRLQEAATLATRATQGFETVSGSARVKREELRAATVKPPVVVDVTPVTPPITPPATIPPTPPPAAFVPPAPLRAAAALVFTARYQDAVTRLATLKYPAGPAAGHAALLRAAAQYSLYLLGGERDERLLAQARQAVAETRRHTPNLRPDPSTFSPRFVQFFSTETRRQ